MLEREQVYQSRESRQFEAAMAGSPVAYAYFDANDRLRHWNAAYEELNFRIRSFIRRGASFPDLLAELVLQGQVDIDGQDMTDWIDERLRARNDGGLALRRLSNGRIYLVHERRDDVGGTLGFWVNLTELVQDGSLAGIMKGARAKPRSLTEQDAQDKIREKLLILQSNLEFLGRNATEMQTAIRTDEALQATQAITDIMDAHQVFRL